MTSDPSNSQANLEDGAACKGFASCISLQVAHARSRQVIPRLNLHDFGRSKTSGSCLGWHGSERLLPHKLCHWHLDHLGQELQHCRNLGIFQSRSAVLSDLSRLDQIAAWRMFTQGMAKICYVFGAGHWHLEPKRRNLNILPMSYSSTSHFEV